MRIKNLGLWVFVVLTVIGFTIGYLQAQRYHELNQPVVIEEAQWTDELRREIVADCLATEGRTERYCNCMMDQADNYPLQSVIDEVHESTQGGEIINTAESICLPAGN